MKKTLATAAAAAVLAFALFPAVPARAAPGAAALAARWAPVHYQDVDDSDTDADFLSRVDFDGDWDAKNNWEHQDDDRGDLVGAAYYSVVSTATHWFLVYAYYHPRDWEDDPDPFGWYTHENDMEGVLLVVRRDGSAYGDLEGMVTVAHSDFYSYVPPGSPLRSGREDVDGTIVMRTVDGVSRPTVAQGSKGHPIHAWDGGGFPGGDGVVYYPGGSGEVPSGGTDAHVGYVLIDTFASGGLWAHRSDTRTFAGWGTFRGDDGKDNAANSAWGWDDHDDGDDLQRGLLATDPAALVAAYFDGTGEFARTYASNPYR